MKRFTVVSLLVGIALFCGSSTPAGAEALAMDAGDDKAPLKVTADRMVSDQNKGVIEFTGSVDAVKGALRVVADKLLVFTDDSGNDFSHIKAIGSVRISRAGKLATGREADYFRDRSTMILTGSPTLDDGKSVARGEKVIYNFETEEMTLLGGEAAPGQDGRATITLFANDDNSIVTGETATDSPAPKTTQPPPAIQPANHTVQVAAFRDPKAADMIARKLRSKGFIDTWVKSDTSGDKPVYRVRVGHFATKEEAKAMEEKLRRDEGIDGLTLYCEKGCD